MSEDISRIESFFIWMEDAALGAAVRDTVWAFATIEAMHLLGLSLLGGALIIVDLRLLGFGLTSQPIPVLARHARRWLLLGIGIMVVTGVPLLFSEAIKAYYNTAFWVKITTLPFALLWTFTVRQRVAHREGAEVSALTRVVALVSLALWFTVAAGGRWIGFS